MSKNYGYSTPQSERIQKISERLSNIRSNVGQEKVSRIDDLERRYQSLESQMWENNETNSQKFSALRDQTCKVQKLIEEEQNTRETLFEEKSKQLEQTQESLQELLQAEITARRETENRLVNYLEEKAAKVRNEILNSGRLHSSELEEVKSKVQTELPGMEDEVRRQKQERESLESNIFNQLRQELDKVETEVASERKAREETEEALLNMLRDVVSRMKSEVDQERRDREATEENLLSLLEDTCNKLNAMTNL
mmetsp:Transcript_7837/g.11558  ORF Transcript_7837/g.11558 Transcript_7837/m.11558 type:complete len:253 (-) Transcript_7837:801-1559(-)